MTTKYHITQAQNLDLLQQINIYISEEIGQHSLVSSANSPLYGIWQIST